MICAFLVFMGDWKYFFFLGDVAAHSLLVNGDGWWRLVLLWPMAMGEGMRGRRGPCCCLWISCALALALAIGNWHGDGDGVPSPHLTSTPHRPSPFRTCQSLLHFTALPLQDNSSFSADGSLCLSVITLVPSFSKPRSDNNKIKPEMTVLIRWGKKHSD